MFREGLASAQAPCTLAMGARGDAVDSTERLGICGRADAGVGVGRADGRVGAGGDELRDVGDGDVLVHGRRAVFTSSPRVRPSCALSRSGAAAARRTGGRSMASAPRATADIPVTAGETLWVEVGSNGADGINVGGPAVFGGGGAPGSDAGGGGGASDVRTCSETATSCSGGGTSLGSRLVVAGGGGGAGLQGAE